jgi:hypothetical protein
VFKKRLISYVLEGECFSKLLMWRQLLLSVLQLDGTSWRGVVGVDQLRSGGARHLQEKMCWTCRTMNPTYIFGLRCFCRARTKV